MEQIQAVGGRRRKRKSDSCYNAIRMDHSLPLSALDPLKRSPSYHRQMHPPLSLDRPQSLEPAIVPAFSWHELILPLLILSFTALGLLGIVIYIVYKLLCYFYAPQTVKLPTSSPEKQIIAIVKKKIVKQRPKFAGMQEEPSVAGNCSARQDVEKMTKTPPPSPLVETEEEPGGGSALDSPSVLVQLPSQLPATQQIFSVQPPSTEKSPAADKLNSNMGGSNVIRIDDEGGGGGGMMGGLSYEQIQPSYWQRAADPTQQRQVFEKEPPPDPFSNKENTMPPGSASTYYSLNSPKTAQYSPRPSDSCGSSSPLTANNTRFSFSPKILKDLASSSPLLPSAGYRQLQAGNYFKFPEVDVFTPASPPTEKNNNLTSDNKNAVAKAPPLPPPSPPTSPPVMDRLRINVEPATATPGELSDEAKDDRNRNVRARTRRARLKSISLDSDGARLVEENIGVPVEELVEITSMDGSIPTSGSTSADSNYHYVKTVRRMKNIHNLTISVDTETAAAAAAAAASRRESEDEEMGIPAPPPQTPKTPVVQKAASLDSEPVYFSLPPQECLAPANSSTSSISVPSTPKRQPFSCGKLKYKMYTTINKSYGSLRNDSVGSSNNNLYFCAGGRKLHSFDEQVGREESTTATSSTNNLQVAKMTTLSVSNNNLKTLPEVTMVSDFGVEGESSGSACPPCIVATPAKKSSILQRRGSNQSLTLHIEGSSNLARGLSASNYSLGTMQGSSYNLSNSSYNIAGGGVNLCVDQPSAAQLQQQHQASLQMQRTQKKLLQRRGSNTSLTLNIQGGPCGGATGSNPCLNRFSSHNSLNIAMQTRADSLSNVTTTAAAARCAPSAVAAAGVDQQGQRRFLSSENLHHFSVWRSSKSFGSSQETHDTPYGSMDNVQQRNVTIRDIDMDDWEAAADGGAGAGGDSGVKSICTKPLSPQTTSEDFKIYLANIQCLQSASNVLTEKQLRSLNEIFQKSYKRSKGMTPRAEQTAALFGLCTAGSNEEKLAEEEEQKKALIKLHQEFWDLPTNYQEKPVVFGSNAKNRYKTILPNEHSRVILDPEPGSEQKPYINANYIKGPDYAQNCYIATQGPMQNTIYEFWQMVHQNMSKSLPSDVESQSNSSCCCSSQGGSMKIAMLTDFVENNRQKCAPYFPKDRGDTLAFSNTSGTDDSELVLSNFDRIIAQLERPDECDDPFRPPFNYFLVQNVDIRHKNGYSIRRLRLIYAHNAAGKGDSHRLSERFVYHYWFPDWPDHRSPDDIDVLLDLSLDLLDGDCALDFADAPRTPPAVTLPVLSPSSAAPSPLPIIHCSAGIGRTGCLAAILNGLRQMRASFSRDEDTGSCSLSVDILGIVCNLRLQRGGMVQNSEQYELIHRALCLYHQRICAAQKEKQERKNSRSMLPPPPALDDEDSLI